MSEPYPRFSLRRMMAGVAAAAVLIWLVIRIPAFLGSLIDDTYYPSEKTVSKTWNAGPDPKIEVDLFAGTINVVQSSDDRVSAVITISALFKNSQARADAAVIGIAIAAVQEGDTIRIRATNPRNLAAFNLQTDVKLSVPPGASLDLQTGDGYIYIGQRLGGPNGNHWVSAPVALKSVKARDLGSWYTGMEAEILSDPSSPPTVLDLESGRGSIRIKGDHLLIKARANRGGIEYNGRLAPGSHSFMTGRFAPHADGAWRLERGIKLVMPSDMEFRIDLITPRGGLQSEFHIAPAAPRKPGVFTGTVGIDPGVDVELRSDDGPIEILKDASQTPSSVARTPRGESDGPVD